MLIIKAQVEKLNFDTGACDKLNLEIRKLNNEIFSLNEKIQKFYTNYPQLNFEYKNPEANFDRQRVKGLVCNLFKIKDIKYATALEVAAGGKVNNFLSPPLETNKFLILSSTTLLSIRIKLASYCYKTVNLNVKQQSFQ